MSVVRRFGSERGMRSARLAGLSAVHIRSTSCSWLCRPSIQRRPTRPPTRRTGPGNLATPADYARSRERDSNTEPTAPLERTVGKPAPRPARRQPTRQRTRASPTPSGSPRTPTPTHSVRNPSAPTHRLRSSCVPAATGDCTTPTKRAGHSAMQSHTEIRRAG